MVAWTVLENPFAMCPKTIVAAKHFDTASRRSLQRVQNYEPDAWSTTQQYNHINGSASFFAFKRRAWILCYFVQSNCYTSSITPHKISKQPPCLTVFQERRLSCRAFGCKTKRRGREAIQIHQFFLMPTPKSLAGKLTTIQGPIDHHGIHPPV